MSNSKLMPDLAKNLEIFASSKEYSRGYSDCKKEYAEKLRWTSVEEKLPENTKLVLCKCELNGRVDYIISKYYKSGWQLNVFYSKVLKVTHWRYFL